jgi:gas vesicle protein
MERKGNSIGVLAIGILIGSVVGTGVALLAAPQSGEKTRTMLREKGMELKTRASTTVQETRVKAEDVVSKVRSRAEELAGRINLRSDQMDQPTEIVAE